MFTNVQATCPRCQGQRQIITKRCGTCNSEKTIKTQHNLAVHIPAGAPEGFEIVFEGEADEGVDWEAGDVVVRVRSRREPEAGGWWRRESGIGGRVVLGLEEVSVMPVLSLMRRRCLGSSEMLPISMAGPSH